MADTEIVFTRQGDDGKTLERVAHTPAEAVKLRFDGWREKKSAASSKTAAKAADSGDKTAK